MKDVSKTYNQAHAPVLRVLGILLFFFINNLISLNPTVQNILTGIISLAVAAYFILLHLQLYGISPLLVVFPMVVVILLIHYFIKLGDSNARNDKEILERMQKQQPSEFKNKLQTLSRKLTCSESGSEESKVDKISVCTTPGDKISPSNHRTRRASIMTGLKLLKTELQLNDSNHSDSDSYSSSGDESSISNATSYFSDTDDSERTEDDDYYITNIIGIEEQAYEHKNGSNFTGQYAQSHEREERFESENNYFISSSDNSLDHVDYNDTAYSDVYCDTEDIYIEDFKTRVM